MAAGGNIERGGATRIGSWINIEPAVGTAVGAGKELRSINSCSLSSSLRQNYISDLVTSTINIHLKGDMTVKCERTLRSWSQVSGVRLWEVGPRCQKLVSGVKSWSQVSGVRLTVCRCQRAVARCQASGVFRQLEVRQLVVAALVGGLIRTQIQVSTKQNSQKKTFTPQLRIRGT